MSEPEQQSNDDLRQLLDELEKDTPIDSVAEFKSPKSSKPKTKGDGTIDIKPLVRGKTAPPQLSFGKTEGDLSEEFQSQFHNLISRYSKISDEILLTYERDRDQAQEVLDHFLNTLATGGKVPRVYVEKIADVIRSKNDIAQTPIRMLDAITKFMSASKGSDALNQMNVSFDSSQLAKLLETSGYDDEGAVS